MDAFFRYLREPHILEDFKSTFDLSAKFKYPEPSEVQKSKYFEQEFNVIFQKFYHYLRSNNTLPGKTDHDVEHNLKNKVDQSDLVIEFDSWLELDANQFTFQEKPKQTIQPMHSSYSNPNSFSNPLPTPAPPKYPPSTPVTRPPEKIITSIPFHIEKNPPPSPSPAATKVLPALLNYQPQAPPRPSMLYTPAQPKQEDKEKPLRMRFMEKLSQYMDCPERMCIIKAELTLLTKKNSN